jgi:hypothetical protein
MGMPHEFPVAGLGRLRLDSINGLHLADGTTDADDRTSAAPRLELEEGTQFRFILDLPGKGGIRREMVRAGLNGELSGHILGKHHYLTREQLRTPAHILHVLSQTAQYLRGEVVGYSRTTDEGFTQLILEVADCQAIAPAYPWNFLARLASEMEQWVREHALSRQE